MSDCFVLYLLLTCMKKKTSGADKFTNNKIVCIVDSSGDITTDVPMEHVVNHLRKRNRNFRRNVSDVHIIEGMVIVFLVCES